MLFLFLVPLLQCFTAGAAPLEHSTLSIPVHDIISDNLSAYESHPNFKLYTRWLDSDLGSYIKRDPGAAFSKHNTVRSVNCHADFEGCHIVSRLAFADVAKSPAELDALRSGLSDQAPERDGVESSPAVPLNDTLEERSWFDPQAKDRMSTLSNKVYIDMGEDNHNAGFQNQISWNLKCETLDFSSNGLRLTGSWLDKAASNKYTGHLDAVVVADTDPATTHANSYGGAGGIIPPTTERAECYKGSDVSSMNCDAPAQSGWCGFHVTQWQKNEGPGLNTENYRFDVVMKDSAGTIIGDWEGASVPSGQTKWYGTRPLQYTLGLLAPAVDADPIKFFYAGQEFDSSMGQCSTGVYEDMKRELDCGFTC